MTENTQSGSPSTGKYIGVWILASISAGIATALADFLVVETVVDIYNISDSPYWYVSPIVTYLIWAVVIIGVYSAFRDLAFGKVIPWMVGLGSLGVALSIARTYSAFSDVGLSVPVIFPIATVLCFAVAVFAVNRYFKVNQPERY